MLVREPEPPTLHCLQEQNTNSLTNDGGWNRDRSSESYSNQTILHRCLMPTFLSNKHLMEPVLVYNINIHISFISFCIFKYFSFLRIAIAKLMIMLQGLTCRRKTDFMTTHIPNVKRHLNKFSEWNNLGTGYCMITKSVSYNKHHVPILQILLFLVKYFCIFFALFSTVVA